MTIYDALSQEHGLLIYHDYLIDNNQELLAEMCLCNVIELEQMCIQSRAGSKSRSRTWVGFRSWVGSWSGSRSMAESSSIAESRARARSGSSSGSWPGSWSG